MYTTIHPHYTFPSTKKVSSCPFTVKNLVNFKIYYRCGYMHKMFLKENTLRKEVVVVIGKRE